MERAAFLSRLRLRKNTVQVDEGEKCIICEQKYGTMSSETETGERKVRLPCNAEHTVGYDCIDTWLEVHNTCPVCEQQLFEPDYEDEDEEDEDARYEYNEDHLCHAQQWAAITPDSDYYYEEMDPQDIEVYRKDGLQQTTILCLELCDALGFEAPDHPIRYVAGLVASWVWPPVDLEDDPPLSDCSIAAACVYAATHLTRQRTSATGVVDNRRSVQSIARVCEASETSIHAIYEWIYDANPTLTREMLSRMGARRASRVWPRLPEPREPRAWTRLPEPL